MQVFIWIAATFHLKSPTTFDQKNHLIKISINKKKFDIYFDIPSVNRNYKSSKKGKMRSIWSIKRKTKKKTKNRIFFNLFFANHLKSLPPSLVSLDLKKSKPKKFKKRENEKHLKRKKEKQKTNKKSISMETKRQAQHTTKQKTLHKHKNQNLQIGNNIRPFLLLLENPLVQFLLSGRDKSNINHTINETKNQIPINASKVNNL